MIVAWNPKRLIDITENPETSGIFSAFSSNVPWNGDIDNTLLNIEYYFNRSGRKKPSPAVNYALGDNEKLSSAAITKLCNVAEGLYLSNWVKEYATLSFEYNPISNYDMTETEGIGRTRTNTVTNTGTQTIADSEHNTANRTNTETVETNNTQSGNETEKNTGTVSDNENISNGGTQSLNVSGSLTVSKLGSVNNDIYGFNSASAVNDRDTSTTDNGTQTENTTNVRTDELVTSRLNLRTDDLVTSRLNTRTEELTTSRLHVNSEDLTASKTTTRTDNLTQSENGGDSENRTLTRSGNIGVTTSQQMIESERQLYLWNFFHNIVFPDLDKLLTLEVY